MCKQFVFLIKRSSTNRGDQTRNKFRNERERPRIDHHGVVTGTGTGTGRFPVLTPPPPPRRFHAAHRCRSFVRWPHFHFQWPHRIASCRRGFAGKWRLGRLLAQLLVLAAAVLSRLFVHGAVSVCCSFCCCWWWWCTSLWLLLQCSFTLILVTPQLI